MSLTIAILSWNAHRTLRNTLESYKAFDLDRSATERLIFFQELSGADTQIAKKYGYDYTGTPNNIGVAAAYKKLVESSTSEFFLFLENDWQLIDYPFNALQDGQDMLRSKQVDVVRYRSRKYPGVPLWTLQYMDNEYEKPTHLLDCVHWQWKPDKFPEIQLATVNERDWYFASSRHANWTNNPTMFRREWLLENIVPRMGNRDVEVDIQEWWEKQSYWVAQSEGLFTHNRIG